MRPVYRKNHRTRAAPDASLRMRRRVNPRRKIPWWTRRDSNPRSLACHANAFPLSYGPSSVERIILETAIVQQTASTCT